MLNKFLQLIRIYFNMGNNNIIDVSNDGLIDIMIGRSRFEKRWQHKEIKWGVLINKLSKTHRTVETYKEYIRAKPERQQSLKDIGGFVGGLMSSGRRKNGSVIHRQLITLDADNNPDCDLFEKISLKKGLACCTYSTHKHSIESARLRLIIPLTRPVDIDEYEAIARKVAEWYGIDFFDPTTFQPTRLMYWPSTSKDGVFYFDYKDGKWLDADKVLNLYEDWMDATQWPVLTSEKEKVEKLSKKQADPLEKVGMIGSFCRTFTIQAVIEKYLPDIYQPGTTPDRYTYKGGTTANGLAIYDDTFAYSHHATDPISGILCNAWDLVRLHKFGSLDDNYDELEKKGSQRPSAKAMQELASSDIEVKTTIGREKLHEAQQLFGEIPLEEGKEPEIIAPDAWLQKMEVDSKANYLNTINNIVLVLENDPAFKSKFRYDDMRKNITINGKLPWRGNEGEITAITDEDYAALRHYLELIYRITSTPKIDDAVLIVASKNVYHPIKEWVLNIEWDGKLRAETMFIDYLGVNDSMYTRTATRKFLVACLYRIFEPGCKFENMPVLVGEQGVGKSTIISRLGYLWFSDSLTNIGSKESFEQLRGSWIIEFGELNSIRNAEVEIIKHFLSKQKDDYRPAYGRVVQEFPRQCVFVGTTNNGQFLKDITGNRRFWPLVCGIRKPLKNIFTEFTQNVVEQIWAEVYTWYMIGEQRHFSFDMEIEAKKVQALHMEDDDRIGAIEEFLEIKLPKDWTKMNIYEKRAYLDGDDEIRNGTFKREYICGIELYIELFRGTYKDFNTRIGREMTNLLKQAENWTPLDVKMAVPGFGRQKVFIRKEKSLKRALSHELLN